MGHRVSLLYAARGREGHIHRRGGEGHTRIGPAMLAYNCHSSDGGVFCIFLPDTNPARFGGLFHLENHNGKASHEERQQARQEGLLTPNAMADRGRPTDYQPQFGEEILQLMAAGLSLAASAAELGFHRQRVYEWMERHPDFADTVKLAQVKRQLFLERRLLSAEAGPVVTSTIFALKNAGPEDWRDKQEHAVDGRMTVEIVRFGNANTPSG